MQHWNPHDPKSPSRIAWDISMTCFRMEWANERNQLFRFVATAPVITTSPNPIQYVPRMWEFNIDA